MKTNRNDTCPCGSGKKYKNCCEEKNTYSGDGNSMLRWIIKVAVGIFFAIIVIIIGIIVGGPLGMAIVMAGVGLLAAGIAALMMEPPEMDELRTLEGATSASYMFRGPVNITREGGPIPVCYGTLLCGSQVLSAWYDIEDISATSNSLSN